MDLQTILFISRSQLKDLGLKKWSDPELIAYANEGKNRLVTLVREAREDFFLTNTTSTVATATAPNASTMTLPTDFLELKDINCTSTGYTDIDFTHCDRSELKFRNALRDGSAVGNGTGVILYDVYGNSSLIFAPGFDVALDIKVDYIKSLADLVLPTEEPTDIPSNLHDYIPNFITCKALASAGDGRYRIFNDRLKDQEDKVRVEIQPRQIREPKFVKGFMEDEEY